MTISVCTLAKGRARHLENLILGLRHSRRPPHELIVAAMQPRRYDLPQASFPIRQVVLGDGKDGALCLAEARNAAASAATGDLLVFLDADCIPDPSLLDEYAEAAERRSGVFMGEVGYLPNGVTDGGVDYARFRETAVRHPDRPAPPGHQAVSGADKPALWSLNFAIRPADYAALGGFDQGYVGYGVEDADFARAAAERHMNLWWVRGATAYHQFHPHHVPPIHHLDAVLANAAHFERKWGEQAPTQWMRAFALMGLVKREGDGWRKLREPGEADFAITRQQEQQPYASAAQVVRWLEERAVRRIDSGGRGKSTAAA